MTCQGGICLPEPICGGWLTSPYTWYLIFISIISWFIIYYYTQTDQWFHSMKTCPIYPGNQAIMWIFFSFYLILLIGTIGAAWDLNNIYSKCFLIVYTIIMILTITWIYAFGMQLLDFTFAIIAFLILMALWLCWLSYPTRSNLFSNILMWVYLVGLLVGLYYNISIYVMNN